MPDFNRRELDDRARAYGFNRDTFEKVLRLTKILGYLNENNYLTQIYQSLLFTFLIQTCYYRS